MAPGMPKVARTRELRYHPKIKSAADTFGSQAETLGVLMVSEILEDDEAIKRLLTGHDKYTMYAERPHESRSQFASPLDRNMPGVISCLNWTPYSPFAQTSPPNRAPEYH